jgi:hypothetical protein
VFDILTEGLASKLSKDEWEKILLCFKESAAHTFVVFDKIVRMMQKIEIPDRNESYSEAEQYSDHDIYNDNEEEANMETASYAIVRMRSHISLQLLIVQVLVKSVLSNPGVVNLLHKFSLKYGSELIIRKRSLHALSLCQMLSYTYLILVSCRASLNCMRHTRALFALSI